VAGQNNGPFFDVYDTSADCRHPVLKSSIILDPPAYPTPVPGSQGHMGNFAPDGRTLAAAGKDRTLTIWDSKTGKKAATASFPQECPAIQFAPTGGLLAIEAVIIGLTSADAVYRETEHNFPVILLLIFVVAGIWRDYARQQGAVLIERYEYLRHTGDTGASDAALWLVPGAGAGEVSQEIRARLGRGGRLDIVGPGEIRSISLKTFDRTFAVTYALEAVAVVIGLFGLSASFGALVLARAREFGMLRHLGMTRRQIGAMLAAEGLLVSGLGLSVGLALGWLISLVLIHVVNRQSFHWGMDLHLPWQLLAVFAAVLLALATFTAVASGRQAMSGDAVRAVKEDW